MPRGIYERTPELREHARVIQLTTHLGRKASPETRAKMSATRKGRPKPIEWRTRMSGFGNGRAIHGHNIKGQRTPTYRTWASMLTRCTNPNASKYQFYGARGISVCERWLTFANFLDNMGERPDGKTLDRIDNEGNYEPSNCRWATAKEQRTNQRPRRPKC